ncbi:MAG: hypothetical protein RLP09_30085 [Sandaracinaceae bacterium]
MEMLVERLQQINTADCDTPPLEAANLAALRVIRDLASVPESLPLPLLFLNRAGEYSFEWRPEVLQVPIVASLVLFPSGTEYELFLGHIDRRGHLQTLVEVNGTGLPRTTEFAHRIRDAIRGDA